MQGESKTEAKVHASCINHHHRYLAAFSPEGSRTIGPDSLVQPMSGQRCGTRTCLTAEYGKVRSSLSEAGRSRRSCCHDWFWCLEGLFGGICEGDENMVMVLTMEELMIVLMLLPRCHFLLLMVRVGYCGGGNRHPEEVASRQAHLG